MQHGKTIAEEQLHGLDHMAIASTALRRTGRRKSASWRSAPRLGTCCTPRRSQSKRFTLRLQRNRAKHNQSKTLRNIYQLGEPLQCEEDERPQRTQIPKLYTATDYYCSDENVEGDVGCTDVIYANLISVTSWATFGRPRNHDEPPKVDNERWPRWPTPEARERIRW